MEAIRVAREAAFVRARQQTLRTRLWFAVSMAAVGVVAFTFGPRLTRWRHARHAHTPAPIAARPAPPAVVPTPPIAMSAAAPVIAEPPVTPVVADATVAAAARPETADGPPAAAAACDTTSIRHAWRLSPEACARAFEADPTNARLALAVAQAEHAHAHAARAAEWAERALALDPSAVEAYVIIARAHAESGRTDDARAAYQHYLDLAPRGWHQAEARAALRSTPAAAPPGSAGRR